MILNNMYVDEKIMALESKRMYKFCKKWSIYHKYAIG